MFDFAKLNVASQDLGNQEAMAYYDYSGPSEPYEHDQSF
jgi:hypothetical protein